MLRFFLAFLLLLEAASAGIVADVRAAITQKNLALAESRLEAYRKQNGVTPEMLEALSWLSRAALAEKQLDRAEAYAAETRKLAVAELKTRKLDDDKHLPIALGAAIEVQAQAMAERGQRDQAVIFLRRELKTWRDTSIGTRIQKNLHLLSLEGKPAPPLDVSAWLGPKPAPLAALRGRPVLLFFWAHWCPDCKAEAPLLARLEKEYAGRGLTLVGPTQHYGYAARGEEVSPAQELTYIDEVRQKFYGSLKDMPVPVSEDNFRNYGASTVPTLVFIDRRGIVRLYHPGQMSYEELAAGTEAILGRQGATPRAGTSGRARNSP